MLRQKRRLASAAGTFMLMPRSTLVRSFMYAVPVSAFSGRPPSAGGLKRLSRHVPVHVHVGDLSSGSVGALSFDSL